MSSRKHCQIICGFTEFILFKITKFSKTGYVLVNGVEETELLRNICIILFKLFLRGGLNNVY